MEAFSVLAVAWSPDGRRIASAGGDQTVRVWDASSGHTTLVYTDHGNAVNSVAWSPDGQYIASASWDWTVRVWNAHTSFVYRGHGSAVNAVAWSPDGRHFASGGDNKTVQVTLLEEPITILVPVTRTYHRSLPPRGKTKSWWEK